MKKKIINGILLVALVFATSSAFVSCKDNDADVKTELYGEIAKLQQKIDDLSKIPGPKGDDGAPGAPGAPGKDGEDGLTPYIGANGNWFIGNTDTGVKAQGEKGADGVAPTLDDIIAALQDQLNDIQAKATAAATEAATKAALAALDEQVGKLTEILNSIYKTQVTSLNIDAIKNPVFGFLSAPVDIQSNLLIACYGKANSNIEFPVGSGNYIAKKDDILPIEYDEEGNVLPTSANAGKLYVTVNPSSVDFSGKTLTLEGTSGKQAPVVLSPLVPSTQELLFGWTRGANAFYETNATIPVDNLKDLAVDITKQDLLDLKDDVKYLIKERQHTKRGAVNLLKDLYDLYTRNMYSAYRLKATWGDGYNTFSETKIAALALKPLSYSFDPEGAISIKELEAMEDKITGAFTSNGEKVTGTATAEDGSTATVEIDTKDQIHTAINKFWNVFNGLVQKGLDNVNYALQPCLLIQEGTKMSRANNHSYTGEILLVPTSRSAEVFAPAYKKYIEVKCDGEIVEGELLNKVIDGTVLAIPLTLESGKKYEIEYQAVDYTGVTRVKNYTIYGN